MSGHRVFEALDRATLWVERPVRRVVGSNRLNPLPHAGTISVFLLMVVVVSGLYITLFFEFGREASYASVASMEGHALQRTIRALHRYSSAAMVLTTVVHAWRIFSARRFSGRQRRWRWVTGMASLLLVWLAGVTGYWLIWDRRAQAINEIVLGLSAGSGWTSNLAVGHFAEVGEGSGSGLLLVIWFVHIGLSAVIVWFMFRHLRASKLAWLPPKHWMLLMGGSLLFVSLVLPAGMLGPADETRLIYQIPLDPFVLFLLPPLLSQARWLVILAGVSIGLIVTILPWLLERRLAPVVEIDADRCTGCDLCVGDCPYDALVMIQREHGENDGEHGQSGHPPETHGSSVQVTEAAELIDRGWDDEVEEIGVSSTRRMSDLIAEVDESACVSCGICVASCAFGAMEIPGMSSRVAQPIAGRSVVVTCERHLANSPDLDLSGDQVLIGVRCAGALSPAGVRGFMNDGAIEVQLIGCPPNDCRYGIGNTLASERFFGDRAPHLPRKWLASVKQDWVAPTDLASAISHPGRHPDVCGSSVGTAETAPGVSGLSKAGQTLLGAGVLIAASVIGVALATRAPFAPQSTSAGVRVVINHQDGQGILGSGGGTASSEATPVGIIRELEFRSGAATPIRVAVHQHAGQSVGVFDWQLDPGQFDIEVSLITDGGTIPLEIEQRDLNPGDRLLVSVKDVPSAPGAEAGQRVFNSRVASCSVCHSLEPGDDVVGPSLAGIASVAGDRVPGLDAELYLRQSILLPDQHVVEGWRKGQMLQIYGDALSPTELEDLLQYLLTLEDQEGSDEGDS